MAENKSKKRVDFEKGIYALMNDLDPTGYNAARYKDFFNSLSNKAFDAYVKKLVDPQFNLHVEFNMFGKGKEKPPEMDYIEKVGKKYGIPLMEYLFMPYANPDDPNNPVVSPTKVLCLVLLVRKMQQMLSKKNSISGDTDVINPLTGQVTGDSKSASLSDTQTNSLVATNQHDTVAELLSMRGDDPVAEKIMLQEISKNGECKLDRSRLLSSNKRSLKTVHTFLLAAGLTSDILKRDIGKSGESVEEITDNEFRLAVEKVLDYRDLENDEEYLNLLNDAHSTEYLQESGSNIIHSSMYKYENSADKSKDDQEIRRLFDKNRYETKEYIKKIDYFYEDYGEMMVPHNVETGKGIPALNILYGHTRYRVEKTLETYNNLGFYTFIKNNILIYTNGKHNKFSKDRPGQVYRVEDRDGNDLGRMVFYYNDSQKLTGFEVYGDKILLTFNNMGFKRTDMNDLYSDAGYKLQFMNATRMIKVLNRYIKRRNLNPATRVAMRGKIYITAEDIGFQAKFKDENTLISLYFYNTNTAYVELEDEEKDEEKIEQGQQIDEVIKKEAQDMHAPETTEESTESIINKLSDINMDEFNKFKMLIIGDNHFTYKYQEISRELLMKYKPSVILHDKINFGEVYTKPQIDDILEGEVDSSIYDVFLMTKTSGYPLLIGIGKNVKNMPLPLEESAEYESRILNIINKYYERDNKITVFLESKHLREEDSALLGEASVICKEYSDVEDVLIVANNID